MRIKSVYSYTIVIFGVLALATANEKITYLTGFVSKFLYPSEQPIISFSQEDNDMYCRSQDSELIEQLVRLASTDTIISIEYVKPGKNGTTSSMGMPYYQSMEIARYDSTAHLTFDSITHIPSLLVGADETFAKVTRKSGIYFYKETDTYCMSD